VDSLNNPAHDDGEISVSNASVTTGDEEIGARERLGLLRGELAELDGRMVEMQWDREELEAEIALVKVGAEVSIQFASSSGSPPTTGRVAFLIEHHPWARRPLRATPGERRCRTPRAPWLMRTSRPSRHGLISPQSCPFHPVSQQRLSGSSPMPSISTR
jgi:hypothetical protein